MANYRFLSKINSPADLKKLNGADIPSLNGEIRNFLVENVSKSGGHLASNLGAVELTVALLRVFSPPTDHIIWDVGHQSYVYKMLTGRRDDFPSLRTPGGLSGFSKRSESEYDAFGTGHSSTSLSAALGFAEADRIAGSDAYTVAVLGDGAYTGGMIHEALNNCKKGLKLIIILNENEMSISKNIGSFAKYIARVRSSKKYSRVKGKTRRIIRRIPLIGRGLFEFVKRTKQMFKNLLYGSNYFEELGLYYLGPADGNEEETVENLLRAAVSEGESAVIHLKTKKGRGYIPAEENPKKYHSINPDNAEMPKDNFSMIFGRRLCALAESDRRICSITAAMADGTGLGEFRQRYRDRFFDVGIAEEHALTFAAGLAAAGMKPFAAVYSSFLQRAYDSLIHDIALQNLPVTVMIDRAGISRRDGATHHGIFDVAFISSIPNFELFAPVSEKSLSQAMDYAANAVHPVAIRYANATDNGIEEKFPYCSEKGILPVRWDFSPDSEPEYLIVTYGQIAEKALEAERILKGKGILCGTVLLSHLCPYNNTADELAAVLPKGLKGIIFLEEGIKNGGASVILANILRENKGFVGKIKILAIDGSFVSPDSPCDIYEYAGISAADAVKAVEQMK